MYTKTYFGERVYMVIRNCGMYNMLNLNSGEAYFPDYEDYDEFVIELERLFFSIEIISNHELELVRVED